MTNTDDLVKRLNDSRYLPHLCQEAAARIRQLEAEKAGAFAMGIEMADKAVADAGWHRTSDDQVSWETQDEQLEYSRRAIRALSPAPGMVMVPVSEVSNG